MKLKEFFQKIKIPWLPISALIFYFIVFLLIKFNILPEPEKVLIFLKELFYKYGLISLFIATILESIVYIGLYFSGFTIIFFIVLFSEGTFKSLFNMSLIITLALVLASIINYSFGRHVFIKPSKENAEIKKERKLSKTFFISLFHFNLLAFYFFNQGLEKKGIKEIFFVPLFIFPYSFTLVFLINLLKSFILNNTSKSIFVFPIILLIWIIVAFIFKNKELLKIK